MIGHEIASSGLLDPQALIDGAGPWALAAICAIIFAETGLLIGFFLPGDTLLFFAGVLTLTGHLGQPLWLVIVVIGTAAAIGGQVGYLIGRRVGPPVFDRRESGVFSKASVTRTQRFFDRFGSASVMLARFIPLVRTFIPVAAGVGRMRIGRFIGFNIIGAFAWAAAVTTAGYLLGQLPGVADFVSNYIDMVLAAIVVLSIGPVLVRTLVLRRKRATTEPESERVDQHA
jgi:membrane-associated protein